MQAAVQHPVSSVQARHVAVAVMLALTLSLPMAMYVQRAPLVAAGAPPAGGLAVTTFNTEYWHFNERELVEALDYAQRDIVLLQEQLEKKGDSWAPVNRVAQLKAVLSARHVDSEGEVVTVSKWPIVARRAYSDGGPDGQILRTDLAVGSRIVSVYNLHLPVHMHLDLLAEPRRFVADVRANAARRERALAWLTADVGANAHPVIVGGDFNSSAAMHGTAWMRTHLADAYSGVHCAGRGDTFSIGKLLHWRIDYLYMSRQLRPASYCTKELAAISDHRAVVASLAFTDAGAASVPARGLQ